MGMGDIFTSKANFTRMIESDSSSLSIPLVVSSVIHKAMIEVDESGTTAAAATGNLS